MQFVRGHRNVELLSLQNHGVLTSKQISDRQFLISSQYFGFDPVISIVIRVIQHFTAARLILQE